MNFTNEQASQLFNQTPLGIQRLAADGTILQANRPLLELLAYPLHDYLGTQICSLCVDPATGKNLRTRLGDSAPVLGLDVELRCGNGESKQLLLDVGASPEDVRRGDRWCTVRELPVHTRASSTSELLHENQRLRRLARDTDAILASVAEGIAVADVHGRLRVMNRSGEQMLGVGWTDTSFEEWSDTYSIYYPDAATVYPPEQLPLARAIRGESVADVELAIRRPTSERIIRLSVSARPIRDDSGTLQGGVAVFRDISERRALEREVLETAATERRRIGQDLHDLIGQELTALGYLVETLADELSQRTAPELALTRKIADGLHRVRQQVPQLVQGLVPVDGDAEGLMAALRQLVVRANELNQARCTFECEHSVLVPDIAVAIQLYRIAQEALNNALKHADAQHITVRVSESEHVVRLEVRDDGRGLGGPSSTSEENGGMGRGIMEYRAKLIGAQLDFTCNEPSGTVVCCSWRETKR